jgi:hypothetical protein
MPAALVPAADDSPIIARTAPAKQKTKLMATRGAKKPLIETRSMI